MVIFVFHSVADHFPVDELAKFCDSADLHCTSHFSILNQHDFLSILELEGNCWENIHRC